MSTDLFSQFNAAIQLAKSGQTAQALTLLRRLLIQQPDNIPGLLWLSKLTPDPHEGIVALEKVLSLKPDPAVAQQAQQGLAALRAKANLPVQDVAPTPPSTATSGPTSPASDPVAQAPVAALESRPSHPTLPVIAPVDVLAYAVTEARAVIWPYRRLNRPIGELLDQGRLTEKELCYAAQQGTDSLRLAARILLKHLSAAPPTAGETVEATPATEMSLTEAQAVPWPFQRDRFNCRPMGELLAEGKLGIRDLRYAIEHAYDGTVAEAAQILFDQHMTATAIKAEVTGELDEEVVKTAEAQPTLQPRGDGSLLVVGSSYYLAQGKLLGRLKMFAGWLLSDEWLKEGQQEYTVFKKGQRGEEEVIAELKRLLDERWTLFRNVVIPGNDADIDAVLVGPQGVLAFEIKAYSGKFRVRGAEWHYQIGSSWRQTHVNPLKQTDWNCQRLAHYLRDKHPREEIPVQAMIVLGREPESIEIIKPSIRIVPRLGLLERSLNPYLAQSLLPDRIVQTIMRTMKSLTAY
ncbi:hypothetical protein TFLX_05436 [Thermoflexales bacterium]|nr:hypothetical protein TFLX_05436 [Thermoflexales bacterium]